MSTAATQPTLRQRVEATLLLHPGRGVALTRLYELLPDATPTRVRMTMKNLLQAGRAIRHGTTRYPAYQLVREGDPLHRPAGVARASSRTSDAMATGTVAATWPPDVRVQHIPAKGRINPFPGVDWSSAISRPGCQDHLLVPSRRGDVRVPHRGPMGICGARQRREQA